MSALRIGLVGLALILAFFQTSTEGLTYVEIALAAILAVICGVTMISVLAGKKLRGVSLTLPLLLFVLFWLPFNMLWAAANGVNITWAVRRAAPLIAFSVTALYIAQVFQSLSEVILVYWLVSLGAVLAVAARALAVANVEIVYLQEFRKLSQVVGGYYSIIGTSLLLPIAVADHRKHLRRIAAAGAFISLVGVVMSLTRTYWIVAALSIMCVGWLLGFTRHVVFRIILWAIFGFLTLSLMVVVIRPMFLSFLYVRLHDLLSAPSDISVINRWQEIRGGLVALTETSYAMLLGRGIGREFTFYSVDPFYPKGSGYVSADYLHNFYLYLWLQLGFPGLILFVWPMVRLCIRGVRYSRLCPAYIAGPVAGGVTVLVGLLVAAVVAPPLLFTGTAVHLGAIAGVTYALLRLSKVPATVVGNALPLASDADGSDRSLSHIHVNL